MASRGDRHCQSITARRGSFAASACFLVGTNELESEALSDQELVTTYKDQGGVERGFRFLKDPLLLASSVTVSKPERIIALPFDHDALLAGLSFSRIPAAGTPG